MSANNNNQQQPLPDKDTFLAQLKPTRGLSKSKEECPICTDKVKKCTRTVCNHFFCYTCLATWLEEHNSCPCCRREFYTQVHEDEDEDMEGGGENDMDDLWGSEWGSDDNGEDEDGDEEYQQDDDDDDDDDDDEEVADDSAVGARQDGPRHSTTFQRMRQGRL